MEKGCGKDRTVEWVVIVDGWMGGGEKGEAGVWLVHMVIHVASYELKVLAGGPNMAWAGGGQRGRRPRQRGKSEAASRDGIIVGNE